MGESPTVYLHLGVPKTGTTFLQNVLWCNRETLRSDGVLYPAFNPEANLHAAMDLQADVLDAGENASVPGAWDRLVEDARRWRGKVVVSHETFGTAREHHIDRVFADLSFAELHLVCTVRDLGRQVPAVWQEDVKNRHTLGFEEFVDAITTGSPTHPLATLFWRYQDSAALLRRWARHLPPEHVHLITVPAPTAPPGTLWQRFADVLALEPGRYALTAPRTNPSLGWSETELLRRVNAATAEIGRDTYFRIVRELLTEQVLADRPGSRPPVVPARARPRLESRAARLTAELDAAGYHVTGDLADLTPDFGTEASPPDTARMLDDAVASLAALLQRAQHPPRRDLRQVLRDYSYRWDSLMRLRRCYWQARARVRR